ncbi:hypothetical protein QJQ45_020010 [Haematococcus lacustris]|nr:hypothetical protein QJQ45_020010 [Haematococcus lacustris]
MQRIGESRWRPLELCYWPEQEALPAKGKEYPGLGYKRLRDKPPKTQPAVAQILLLPVTGVQINGQIPWRCPLEVPFGGERMSDTRRIGESKWRPLELCYWPEQGKLPAKGKEYPGLGYKRVRDKPPKTQQQQQQQQQQQPAVPQ